MNPSLLQVREKIRPVVDAALKRGVHSRRDLEVVVAVELALHGLALSQEMRLTVCPSVAGTEIQLELWVREIARGPAKVYELRPRHSLRLCRVCEGPGCLWCKGVGRS